MTSCYSIGKFRTVMSAARYRYGIQSGAIPAAGTLSSPASFTLSSPPRSPPAMLIPMRPLAFFEAIAEHADQADPIWVESVSGMLVLRFFEDWLDSPAVASMNEAGIGRMRGMIDEIQNSEVRHLLGTAVTVLMEGE